MPPRGVTLVRNVIKRVRTEETEDLDVVDPTPVPAAVLDTLTFPDGQPLPPSLRHWLSFDGSWLAETTDYFDGERFTTCTIAEAVRDTISPDHHWDAFNELERYADTPVFPLDPGSETVRLLLLAGADRNGEYPVITADVDDSPMIYISAPGFDVWLAELAQVTEDVEEEYEADLEAAKERVLDGEDELIA